MNETNPRRCRSEAVLILAITLGPLLSPLAGAQEVLHQTVRVMGGAPGCPVMSGVQLGSNSVTVTWDGPAGYYQLLQASGILDTTWTPAAPPNRDRFATLALQQQSNLFFRVIGPAPQYVGAQTCAACHPGIHQQEMRTRHAQALETLKQVQPVGQQNNPLCLPCHTVGYGLPTGFISEAATPNLAGVQCENCHGPGGNHAADENDVAVRPRVELAATVCGGCHTGPKPAYDEWITSGHAEVVEDMNPSSRIEGCGRCHSGSSRFAQLRGLTGTALTDAVQGDANVPIVCVTCHDPHAQHVFTNTVAGIVYTNQVRNPLFSTNDYFITTSGTLTNQYNPNVNICAQCHNHRGASYTSSSRPPHHSPQYNMLLGTVGILPPDVQIAITPHPHTGARVVNGVAGRPVFVTNQCVTCHIQTEEHEAGQSEVPSVAGHTFKVDTFKACSECHAFPENYMLLASNRVENLIQEVKANLDLWAMTRAAEQLRTNYGTRSWEYTNPGELSPGGSGPGSAEQADPVLVPDNIKKARFNLYLVLYDGSHGVHNGPYAIALLKAANGWVQEELNEVPVEQLTEFLWEKF